MGFLRVIFIAQSLYAQFFSAAAPALPLAQNIDAQRPCGDVGLIKIEEHSV